MTDAERNLVIECLESYRRWLGTTRPEKREMLESLVERFKAAKVSDAVKPQPNRKPITVPTKSDGTPTVPEAQEQVERIVEMCEQVMEYDTDEANEFAGSVQEKAESILVTIEERNHVTRSQAEALDNMESGISRWIR